MFIGEIARQRPRRGADEDDPVNRSLQIDELRRDRSPPVQAGPIPESSAPERYRRKPPVHRGDHASSEPS